MFAPLTEEKPGLRSVAEYLSCCLRSALSRDEMHLHRLLHPVHTASLLNGAWTERLREDAFSDSKCFHARCSKVNAANMVGHFNEKIKLEICSRD